MILKRQQSKVFNLNDNTDSSNPEVTQGKIRKGQKFYKNESLSSA